jgi:CRISPR-associated endonuclease/helicase Cas3
LRPLMEEAYRLTAQGHPTVALAPTGYGKTLAAPEMRRRALEEGLAGGLVHVAPLRSLVRRVYTSLFERERGAVQMHAAERLGYRASPYLLSELVTSTMDSYLWALYRLPVLEAFKVQRGVSEGHYYPALLGILTSLNFFDEAHLYTSDAPGGGGGGVGLASFLAAASLLAGAGTPLLLGTATLHPRHAGLLARRLRGTRFAALRAPASSPQCPYLDGLRRSVGDSRLATAADPGWEQRSLLPHWETRLAPSWDSVVPEACEEASRGLVLVVANTVEEAVRLYGEFRRRDCGSGVVLVHGRLSEGDRASAEDGIERLEERGGVVVATQTVEAGVDVNASIAYTAAAPLESLAQRAGRACRRGRVLDECLRRGGRLVVVWGASRGPYSEGLVEGDLETLKGALQRGSRAVDWRAVCNRSIGGATVLGYATLLAGAPGRGEPRLGQVYATLGRIARSDIQPWAVLGMLESLGLCSVFRGTFMAPIDVGGDHVVVSMDWALARAGRLLEFRGGAPVLVLDTGGGGRVEVAASRLWQAWRARRARSCSFLLRGLAADLHAAVEGGVAGRVLGWALKARRGVYRRGVGLAA